MNKLEPICRVLAGIGWDHLQHGYATKEQYIKEYWKEYGKGARTVVQALVEMAIKNKELPNSACEALYWLHSLLEDLE